MHRPIRQGFQDVEAIAFVKCAVVSKWRPYLSLARDGLWWRLLPHAGLFLVVLSYDMGVIDALNLDKGEQCPDLDGKQSILVERTNDLAICAQADFAKKIVYSRFFYFKLPSDGTLKSFQSVSFHPDQVRTLIGAEP